MTTTIPRRLTIPAPMRDNDEAIVAGCPWFLRPTDARPEDDGPGLLTFTTDGFVDRFLAGVSSARDGIVADAFERLEPWRDFSEPPAAMIDASGTPLFPGSVGRTEPRADELAEGAGPVPDEGPHPWLRKVYRPMHGHFHLAAMELSCDSFGYPKIGRSRIAGAGAVIRRLSARTDRVVWEDWVEGAEGRGLWHSLADESMVLTGSAEKILDPDHLDRDLPASLVASLHARLGLNGGQDARIAMPVAGLAMLPEAVPGSNAHSVVFGYVPIASSALEVREQDEVLALEEIRNRLHARARTVLSEAFYGSPTVADQTARFIAIRRRMRDSLTALIGAVILPLEPLTAIDPRPAEVQSITTAAVFHDFLLDAIRIHADTFVPVANWWDAVVDSTAQALDVWLSSLVIDGSPVTFTFDNPAGRAFLSSVLFLELKSVIEEIVPPDPETDTSGVSAVVANRFLSVVLLRLRAMRRRLIAQVTVHALTPPINVNGLVENDEGSAPALVTAFTVQSNSAELSAWLETNEPGWRAEQPLAWPITPVDAHLTVAHAAGVELEATLADIDDRAASAGAVYLDWRAVKEPAARSALDNSLAHTFTATYGPGAIAIANSPHGGPFTARELGIAVAEQPTFGLLALPGVLANKPSFDTTLNTIASGFQSAPEDRVLSEQSARVNAVVPRFDADHLYTIQCFARIAGRDPCERERVVWSRPGEVFQIADPMDLLGLQPVALPMPDLRSMLRDLPRVPKARARPVASVTTPPDSGYEVGADMADTRISLGMQMICTFGIPVFTICAFILFQIIYNILKNLPGFTWMPLMRVCFPGRQQ